MNYFFSTFAKFAIIFFVPAVVNAISNNVSLPIGFALNTTPSPYALCTTVSPALKTVVFLAGGVNEEMVFQVLQNVEFLKQ